jgi:probable HAF family extracellular repeat protein
MAISFFIFVSACGSGPDTSSTTRFPDRDQGAMSSRAKPPRYVFKDLGTLGGSNSQVNGGPLVLNEQGTAVGGAETSVYDPICDCLVMHAVRWTNGAMADLGTLPGGEDFSFAIVINSSELVAGISSDGLTDPLTGSRAFVATSWKNGRIKNLGTFGGSFSLPDGINDRGQVVGGAQNTTPTPFSYFADLIGAPTPSTQMRAALWQDGRIQDLGTLGTGEEAFAFSINERGQVAGLSFTETQPEPTTGRPNLRPFCWENGRMTDLGSFGGTQASVGNINKHGQIAGASYLAGDMAAHAFLWDRGELQDLGTLEGDIGSGGNAVNDRGEVIGVSVFADDSRFTFVAFLWRDGRMIKIGGAPGDDCSNPQGINSKGQVVGLSLACSDFGIDGRSNAFLWENGGPGVDLNVFVPTGSGIRLTEATFISDRGEIAGVALLPNGDQHAFVLVPSERDLHAAGSSGGPGGAAVLRLGQRATKAARTRSSLASLARGLSLSR